MAVSDLNGHDRPPHSACTLRHLPREAVPPEVPDGAVLFPPAPGVVPMYFVWEVGGAFGLFHTNCMMRSPMYFVWQNICPVPKANSGWRIYFDRCNFFLDTVAATAECWGLLVVIA